MSHVDLDLNNYNMYDILGLFDIPYDYDDHGLKKANKKLDDIKSSVDDNNIIDFYNKAYTCLDCLNKFRMNRKLAQPKYLNNQQDDEKLIKAVVLKKDISRYDSVLTLLQEILQEHDGLTIKYDNEFKPDRDIIPSNAGTDYFDLGYKKDNVIIDTFPNTVVPGKINPLKRIVQYTNLHLNSCFRDKYYNSNPCDFHYNLPSEIKNVLSLRLASIELPNAWYLYNYLRGNNRFKIEITIPVPCEGKKCAVFDIIVPDGNYDADTLVEYLNTTYFYKSKNKNALQYIKFAISKYNNKTEFGLIDNCPDDIVFSLHFTAGDNIMETFGWSLGFRLSRYIKIEGSIQSEGLFDGGGDRYIYFALNDFQYNVNEHNIVYFECSTLYENILAKIPTVNGKLCLIVDENEGNNYTKTRRYNGPINLQKFHVLLMDKFGEVIDLNNMDFSFTLELEILYERNSIL